MKDPHILMDLLEATIRVRDSGTDEEVAQLVTAFDRAEKAPDLPKVVCLCGSTRFYEEFQKANFEQTMLGNIVLSVGFYPHGGFESRALHGGDVGVTPEEKVKLDELHKRKIDLCDYVLVLNKNGYIGDSTRSEIEYALAHGKQVGYLEPPIIEG